MGKKRVTWVLELLDVPTRRELLLSLLYQSLYLVSCYLYYLTLEAGDIDFLKERAPYFAILLLLNLVIIISVTIAIQQSFKHKLRLKVLNWLVGMIFLSLTLTHDLGTDLEHHGQYNLMLYFLLWLPLLVISVLCKIVSSVKKCCGNDRL
jgi:hypothetical protein